MRFQHEKQSFKFGHWRKVESRLTFELHSVPFLTRADSVVERAKLVKFKNCKIKKM
jgi:hypothetical protein